MHASYQIPQNVDRSHTCSFENCSLYQSHNSALIEEARAHTPSIATAANLGNRTTGHACNPPWVPQSVASGSSQARISLISSSLVIVVVLVVVDPFASKTIIQKSTFFPFPPPVEADHADAPPPPPKIVSLILLPNSACIAILVSPVRLAASLFSAALRNK